MNLANDLDLVQWIFDSEYMMNHLGGPIDAQEMCELLREMHAECKKDPGDAEVVREAWDALARCVGPRFIGQFISCGTWREIVPEPADTSADADDVATVWSQGGTRVIAQVAYEDDRPVGVEFVIQRS